MLQGRDEEVFNTCSCLDEQKTHSGSNVTFIWVAYTVIKLINPDAYLLCI